MTEIPLGNAGPSRQGFGIGIVLFAVVFIGLLPNAAKTAYQECANPLAVLTILFAILLVHEWLTAIQWLGVALVAASLLVMEMPRKVR